MILGVALVVDDIRKGHRLVFRYPEVNDSNVKRGTDDLLAPFYHQYASFSSDNFAKLFLPKASMLNKSLELVIDDLSFLSFPMPCHSSSTGHSNAAGGDVSASAHSGSQLSSESVSDSLSTRNHSAPSSLLSSYDHCNRSLHQTEEEDVITMFNIVVVTARPSALSRAVSAHENYRGARFPCCDMRSEMQRPGSNPVEILLGVGNADLLESSILPVHLITKVVESFSKALLHEEKSNRYVSREVARLLHVMHSTSISNARRAGHSKKACQVASPVPLRSSSGLLERSSPTAPKSPSRSPSPKLMTSAIDVQGRQRAEAQESALICPVPSSASLMSQDSGGGEPQAESSDLLAGSKRTTSSSDKGRKTSSEDHSNSRRGERSLDSSSPPSKPKGHVSSNLDKVFQTSSIANEMRSLYHGLQGGIAVVLTVNNAVNISIPLLESSSPRSDPNGEEEETHKSLSQLRKVAKSRKNHIFDKHQLDKPYLTLLTISDREDVVEVMNALGQSSATMQQPGEWNKQVAKSLASSNTNCDYQSSHSSSHQQQSNKSSLTLDADILSGTQVGSLRHRAEQAGCLSNSSPFAESYSASIRSPLSRGSLGCSPKMMEFLSFLNPTQSFAEIRQKMEVPFNELFAMAHHLCSWGLAEVICTVSSNSVYKVHPQLNLESSGDESSFLQRSRKAFSSAFGGMDLFLVLSLFNGQLTVQEVIQRLPSNVCPHGVDIVVWMLRRHLLRELHRFLVEIPSLSGSDGGDSPQTLRRQSQDIVKSGSSSAVKYYDRRAQYQDARTRKKIAPYLDGSTPLCEVLWLEDISEEDVLSAVRNSDGKIVINTRAL